MDLIPIVRGTWLLPFTSYLQQAGANYERYLQKARLPVMMADPANDFISLRAGFQFMDIVANAEGIDHFALRVGEAFRLDALRDLRAKIASAPFMLLIFSTLAINGIHLST